MSTGTKRTYIIEATIDPETGEVAQDREKASRLLGDLLGTLWTVGGALRVVSDRVHVGDLPPDREGGRSEPMGETVGLIIEYTANTPLNKASRTAAMLDAMYPSDEDDDEDEEPATGELEPVTDETGAEPDDD